ncbi:hypothetical protein L195_g034876 [Trifolium pratense]|uniref:Uncharacterized protein n=1 Tax=Trifolium pratense TaxID=57577 RepID=A0A2K3LK21_TRIPR|nr:hypothetical protein L195_g034876 [Trifolium pratense]
MTSDVGLQVGFMKPNLHMEIGNKCLQVRPSIGHHLLRGFQPNTTVHGVFLSPSFELLYLP